jgi:hypothetical protein
MVRLANIVTAYFLHQIAKDVDSIMDNVTAPEASFLKVSLRLCGNLAPTQRWRLAQLVPTCKLAPTEVLKNCPLEDTVCNVMYVMTKTLEQN